MNIKQLPKLPREFQKQVREACKHYDKPERLGKLPLASVALHARLLEQPHHPTDLVGRGNALKHVISITLDQLNPLERHTREWEIYLCLYCYVHQRDPYNSTFIGNVQIYVEVNYQIPKATYIYRLTKEGIPQLSYLISRYLSEQTTWIEPIPQTLNLIGRKAELADYRQQLEKDSIAVIEGIGGIGKTALAAKLATSIKAEGTVCWLTIRVGLNDTPMAVLYAWAVFLAQHDYPQLWAFMRATATEEKRLPEYYPILRKGLAKVRPLLCLDNLEMLSTDEEGFWSLLSILQQEPDVTLLLISQQRPSLSGLGDYPLLGGLSSLNVQVFMQQRGLDLSLEQAEKVTEYTLGNPRLLELWSAYIRQKEHDIDHSLSQLQDSKATKYFLATEVVGALTTSQQQLARLFSLSRESLDCLVLQTPPKELQPLPLDIETSDFTSLQRLGLIQNDAGEKWSLSPLLKKYFSYFSAQQKENDSLFPFEENDRTESITLHQWLARLYTLQGNELEFAYHAIQGEQSGEAVLRLAEQQYVLIEQGRASAMSFILTSIQADDLSTPVRKIWRELKRKLWLLSGEYEAVETEIHEAVREAETEEDLVYTERAFGELAKRRSEFSQAADHYQQALRLLEAKKISLQAGLHRDLAWVLTEQNELDQAWNQAQHAGIALANTLGTIAERRGNLDEALDYYKEGVTIAKSYRKTNEFLEVRNNLALLYWTRQEFKQALNLFKENLKVIEQIGFLQGEAITHLNMGICYAELGLLDESINETTKASSIFTDLDDVKGQTLSRTNLAELYLRMGKPDIALEHAKAAISIGKEQSSITIYGEAQRVYAEVLLAQGEPSAALTFTQQALDNLRKPNTIADEPNTFIEPFYAKLACETLARIHTALGNSAEAEKYEALARGLQEKLHS